MNCLEFRRILAADPASQDRDVLRHMSECARCAAFAHRQNEIEGLIRQAVTLDVPEDLEVRVLLRQSHGVRQRELRVRRRWLALAASVLLTMSLTAGFWSLQNRHALEQAVLGEIYNELTSRNSRDVVPVSRVNEVWQSIGAVVDKSVGTVNFVSRCPIRDSYGGHLIVPGSKGPVSVIVMPDESVRFSIGVRDDRFNGIIVPGATGSIAIVGSPGEDIAALASRARAAIRYRF